MELIPVLTGWSLATAALVLAMSVVGAIWAWQSVYWQKLGVPSLPVEPIFGNTRDRIMLRACPGEMFMRLYNQLRPHPFGGIFQAWHPTLLVRDPELIKKILVKDHTHFEDRGLFVNEETNPLSAHLFNLSGSRWRKLRFKLTPLFSSSKMKMMFSLMHECVLDLRALLKEPAARGEVMELNNVMGMFTTDVIGSCAFGQKFNTLRDPNSEFLRMAKAVFKGTLLLGIRHALATFFQSVDNIRVLQFPPRYLSDFFLRTFKETIEYREKNNIKRNDLIQLLTELRSNALPLDDHENTDTLPTPDGPANSSQQDSGGIELTDSLLAAQAFAFFAAGHESPKTTMGFALHELALNPDLQDKLQVEIDMVLREHGGVFSYESIQKMNYLDKVMEETMRKYPPVPMLLRQCTVPYTIPGSNVTICRGTRVIVSVLGMHNDPDFFPEPEKFDPERFSEDNKAKRPRFAYLPFGDGPRYCLGMRFGQLVTKLGLAALLHSYRFTPCEETQRQFTFEPKSIVTTPEKGIWLRIASRNSNAVEES